MKRLFIAAVSVFMPLGAVRGDQVATPEISGGGRMNGHQPAALLALPLPGDLPPPAPPSGTVIEGINFDENGANTGAYSIPPDPHGAVGPNHLVSIVNTSIEWHTKAGVQQNSQKLGTVPGTPATGSFFEPLAPVTTLFDPKVIYDQFKGRFVVVALEQTDNLAPSPQPANTSRILVAVSDDADPNGTWWYLAIDGKTVIGGIECWADYPGLAVDDEAIYITANMFSFKGNGGGFGGVRLWIVDKNSLYDGGAGTFTVHDPYAATPTTATTTQPAHIFGNPPAGTGTFLVSYYVQSSGTSVQVVRVSDPLTTPTFSQQLVNIGTIDSLPLVGNLLDLPSAPQKGTTVLIDTGQRRALNAVWRDHRLWTTASIVPAAGANAGQVTAHWWEMDTTSLNAITLFQQGDVGGEAIAAGAYTFYPSVAVDADGNMGIGFAVSAPTIYPSMGYTGRLATDLSGTTEPEGVIAAGTDYYFRAFGDTRNRWGDYSGISLDPADGETFCVFNQYAMARGSVVPLYPTEDGRWATRWGCFRFERAVAGECCGGKPAFADATYSSTFTGQVAVATYPAVNATDPVLAVFDLKGQASATPNQNFAPAAHHGPAAAPWSRSRLGNIFGLTLDASGNIYVTATTAYGGSYLPSGATGGEIYKINGITGLITPFQTLPKTSPAAMAHAGLGNIAYDCAHHVFHVTNLDNGLIYRLSETGGMLGTWNHGGSLPTPIDDDMNRFTRLGRRVWAVRPHNGRLYYSVWWEDLAQPNAAQANEVWSVGLAADGAYVGPPVLAVSLPPLPGKNYSHPVSDISFGPSGTMLLAERGMRGDTSPVSGESRAVECTLTNGVWTPNTTKFKIGQGTSPGTSAGGCDYDFTVGGRVWVSGYALHRSPPDTIYGIQGLASNGGSIADSILIDANGNTATTDTIGVGTVKIPCPVIPSCEVAGTVECPRVAGGPFFYDFTVTNNSGLTATSMILQPISGLTAINPNTRVLTPALETGHSRSFSDFELVGALPGQQVCFEVVLLTAQNQRCCSTRVCITLPDCSCFEVVSSSVQCLPGGQMGLTIKIKNLESYPLYHAYFIVADSKNANPTHVALPGVPKYGMVTLETVIYNVSPGEVVPVTLSIHAADFVTCCSRALSFRVNCPFDPGSRCSLTSVVQCHPLTGKGTASLTIYNDSPASQSYTWTITGLNATSACPAVLPIAAFAPNSGTTIPVPASGSKTITIAVDCSTLTLPPLTSSICANYGVLVTNVTNSANPLSVGCAGIVQKAQIFVGAPMTSVAPLPIPLGSGLILDYDFINTTDRVRTVSFSLSSDSEIFGFSMGGSAPSVTLNRIVTLNPGQRSTLLVYVVLLTSDPTLVAPAFMAPSRLLMDVDLDGDGFTETPVEFLAQLTSPAQPIFAEVLHHACYETLSHEYRMQLDCHFSPGVVANVQRSFDLQTWEFVPFSTTIGGSAAETAVIGNGGVFSLFMDAAEPRAFFRIFADLRNSPP